jgi:hypothetical protein
MNRNDYRQEWTANVKVGDKVILVPCSHFSPATLRTVTKIGYTFIGFEGKKFSRTTLHEMGKSLYFCDRIEKYTEAAWTEHQANAVVESNRLRAFDLTRKIHEKVTIRNGGATQELEILEKIAAILGINLN